MKRGEEQGEWSTCLLSTGISLALDRRLHESAAIPGPLNPKGEVLLGVTLESPDGVANCEQDFLRAD